MSERQPEPQTQERTLAEHEQSLQSALKKIALFCDNLPIVGEAYELLRCVPTISTKKHSRGKWRQKAVQSLKKIKNIKVISPKKISYKQRIPYPMLADALRAAINSFYKRWQGVFEQAQETTRKACEALPTSRADDILRKVHPHFIESTYKAVEEALKSMREFREAIEEEQNRDTPEGRRKRLKDFCANHGCTRRDVWISAGTTRVSMYNWLKGKAPRAGVDIARVLAGEVPLKKAEKRRPS